MDAELTELRRKALVTRNIEDQVRYLVAWLRTDPELQPPDAAQSVVETAVQDCHSGNKFEGIVVATLASDDGCNCNPDGGGTCSSYCDTWSWAAFKTADGKFGWAHESSDTSGHG